MQLLHATIVVLLSLVESVACRGGGAIVIALLRLHAVVPALGLLEAVAPILLGAEGVTETDVVRHRTSWGTIGVHVRLDGVLKIADVVDDVFDELLTGHVGALGASGHQCPESVEVEAHLRLVGGHVGVGSEGCCYGNSQRSISEAIHPVMI